MKCPACGQQMECREETVPYTDAGLENIYVEGAQVCRCACGEYMVGFKALPELHRRIGERLLTKAALLTGPEIRFLRKNMRLKGLELANLLGVEPATVYRWEAGDQAISRAHDRLMRLVYAAEMGLAARPVVEAFTTIAPRQTPEDMRL